MCFISHMVFLPFILHLNLTLAACPTNFNPRPDEFKTPREFPLVYKQSDVWPLLGTPLLLHGLLFLVTEGNIALQVSLRARGCGWAPVSPQTGQDAARLLIFSHRGGCGSPSPRAPCPGSSSRHRAPLLREGATWPPHHPLWSVSENCAAGTLAQNSGAVVWLRLLLTKGAMTWLTCRNETDLVINMGWNFLLLSWPVSGVYHLCCLCSLNLQMNITVGAFSSKNGCVTLQIHASADGLGRERKGLFCTELHNTVSGCHHFQHIWPIQFPVSNQLSLSPKFSFLLVWLGSGGDLF